MDRPAYNLANDAVGGNLDKKMLARRERGDTFEDIAFWLRGRGVKVSVDSVRQWCNLAYARAGK